MSDMTMRDEVTSLLKAYGEALGLLNQQYALSIRYASGEWTLMGPDAQRVLAMVKVRFKANSAEVDGFHVSAGTGHGRDCSRAELEPELVSCFLNSQPEAKRLFDKCAMPSDKELRIMAERVIGPVGTETGIVDHDNDDPFDDDPEWLGEVTERDIQSEVHRLRTLSMDAARPPSLAQLCLDIASWQKREKQDEEVQASLIEKRNLAVEGDK